jgi:hypothetical protein
MKFTHKKSGRATDSGRYVTRRKASGAFTEVTIVSPKKGPTSVSLSEIRKAVRQSYAAQKSR